VDGREALKATGELLELVQEPGGSIWSSSETLALLGDTPSPRPGLTRHSAARALGELTELNRTSATIRGKYQGAGAVGALPPPVPRQGQGAHVRTLGFYPPNDDGPQGTLRTCR